MGQDRRYPKMTMTETRDVGTGREEPIPEGKSQFPHFLGLPTTVVSPGANAVIMAQPQLTFKAKRLAIDPAAGALYVSDIRVGCTSMLFSQAGAPASCFPPLPRDVEDMRFLKELEDMILLNFATLQVAQILSLHVTNPTDKPITFRGVLWGLTSPDI